MKYLLRYSIYSFPVSTWQMSNSSSWNLCWLFDSNIFWKEEKVIREKYVSILYYIQDDANDKDNGFICKKKQA